MHRQTPKDIAAMLRLTFLFCAVAVAAHAAPTPRAMPSAPSSGYVLAHTGHAGAQATGTVNSVDPSRHTIKVSHAPIRALHWPAMTMEFSVDPAVDLDAIKPGMKIDFTLVHEDDGSYQLHEVSRATGN
jgi:Cu(I)/Ag(I) efflux system periplasmic protein CusF